MSVQELLKKGARVIDVRSKQEFESGHYPNALNIPHDQIANRLGELGADKTKPIIVYCLAGGRAGIAKKVLKENGFTTVLNAGGYSQIKDLKP